MYLKNLVQLRKDLGFNQKEFAEQLGIKQTTYNGYEKGKTDPGIDFLKMVATKYDVTTDYLAGLSVDIKKAPPSEDEDADRMKLLENYDNMNDAGRDRLVEHSQLLSDSPQYKKCGQFCMGEGTA